MTSRSCRWWRGKGVTMPVVAAMIAGTGCGSAHRDARVDTVGAPASITAGDGPAGTSDADDQGSDEAGEGSGGEGSAPVDACKVANDLDAIGECEATAPPDAFEPEVQWVWRGGEESSSVVIPLVSNLTDDNGDGEIDLCDIPDVVVLASGQPLQNPGHLYLLDGASGTLHRRFEEPLASDITPALGDIDGDGVPEIVAMDLDGRAVAFEHDGALKWRSDVAWGWHDADFVYYPEAGAIALADLDADGDVEIILGTMVVDHRGHMLWTASDPHPVYPTPFAVDLDGDGTLEVLVGAGAYRADGTQMWNWSDAGAIGAFAQVADLDLDGLPEVLLTTNVGLSVLTNDGTVVFEGLTPTGVVAGPEADAWLRPAAVHDFDGDGVPEFSMSSGDHYTVYEADGSIVWDTAIVDRSGVAGGTAFDFLGDGTADAMYADEQSLYVFDDRGHALLETARASITGTEYPVVADIDNDGSAEILVVSNRTMPTGNDATVQAIRDVDDRWIQARRIWNQHAYHVTNVREDGTIPRVQQKSWIGLNSFRTNAQIEGGTLCRPNVEG